MESVLNGALVPTPSPSPSPAPTPEGNLISKGGKTAEALAKAIKRTRSGKIKTRTLGKENLALYITLGVLLALTAYTFATMGYGKVSLLKAAADACEDFWLMMSQPGLGGHFTYEDVISGLFVSVALAVLTTTIGAAMAFVLGLFAAVNLSNRAASNAIKVVMSFFRAVPSILWVLIFTVSIGLGSAAAVIGLLFHSVAFLVKAYSETFEEVDQGALEALRSCGASWWQIVFAAVVPVKTSELLSWTFIRFEINFVQAVAVGAVAGAGGIGFQLYMAGHFYSNIHEVGLIVYLCLSVAVVLEILATKLRQRYIVAS